MKTAAWTRWMTRSGRVIEVASQQAVENMLLQPSLLHQWVQSCKKSSPAPRAPEWAQTRSQQPVPVLHPGIFAGGDALRYLSHDYHEIRLKEDLLGDREFSTAPAAQWTHRINQGTSSGARWTGPPEGTARRRHQILQFYASGDDDPAQSRGPLSLQRESVPGDRG
jgi:hypothetical protein